jgi:transcriptional regulator with XRE-family HTH domain
MFFEGVNMTIPERVRVIMQEKGLNQKKFAQSIYVTEGYISRFLKGEIGISNSTVMLIEKVHGYTREWILNGAEPKMSPAAGRPLSPLQRTIIQEVEAMTDEELFIIAAYIEALKKKKAGEQAGK